MSPRVRFAAAMDRFGDRTALITSDGRSVSYRSLIESGDTSMSALRDRSLVAIQLDNSVASVGCYIGALRHGHVVIGLSGDRTTNRLITDRFEPDVILDSTNDWTVEESRPSRHPLHDDLALLLSTSGSTGAPKLVRLSTRNLDANATSIVSFLGLDEDSVGLTTLPLHYCYGLSVLHSHLAAGATVSLTSLSVSDSCLWSQARRDGVTGFAGVPYTFEMLEQIDFDPADLPSLRYMTQAGGAMPCHRVRRLAEAARQGNCDLFVMYGQTEATARMAYLPPAMTVEHPDAVGVAIPGGEFRIDAPPGDRGEVIYRGPNVMLGYAESPADLADGRTVDELRTGDIGWIGDDGLLRVTGRTSRFVKPFGLRIELDRVESALADHGCTATVAGDDEGLVIALPPRAGVRTTDVGRITAELTGLPPRAIVVVAVEVPRRSNGKPDFQSLIDIARTTRPKATLPTGRATIAQLYQEALDLDESPAPTATFIDLGGDSLSYVELSVALGEFLDEVPSTWHLMSVGELQQVADHSTQAYVWPSGSDPRQPDLASRPVETNVVLRAAATLLIVATHAGITTLQGGAHVLLAVAGFNFARFRLPLAGHPDFVRSSLISIARIAIPTLAWLAFQFTYAEPLEWPRALLVNNYLGTGLWEYWFIEVLIQTLLVATALFASRRIAAINRRFPFPTAVTVLIIATVLRFHAVTLDDDARIYLTTSVLWCFALGWAAHVSRTHAQRLAISAIAMVCVVGFFGNNPSRELAVGIGLAALVWIPSVHLPKGAVRLVSTVASASLAIYLTQWGVLRAMGDSVHPVVVATTVLAVGVSASALHRFAKHAAQRRDRHCFRLARLGARSDQRMEKSRTDLDHRIAIGSGAPAPATGGTRPARTSQSAMYGPSRAVVSSPR